MYELHTLNSEGEKVPVEIGTSNLELKGKKTVLGVFRNISERMKAEERQEFLHSLLRHDVRNKIQITQGYHELLEDLNTSEKFGELIQKAKESIKESMDIIEKVSQLREAQEEEIKDIEIEPILKKTIEQEKNIAEDKGIRIETNCPDIRSKVKGGPLLNQVFSNIIENSIQHSECNKIQINGDISKNEVICTIEDDGKGISEQEKEKIFNKGYTTDQERGTGLGLFLVKTLLEIYDGSIEVKDSDLGGSKFIIHLKKL